MSNVQGFLGQIETDQTDDLSFIDGLNSTEDLLDVVEGLGAIARKGSTSPRARTTAVKGAQKAAARAKAVGKSNQNETNLTSLKTMLANRVGDIEDETIRTKFEKQELTVVDTDLYTNRMAVSGTTRMTDPALNRKRGARNFGKAQLPSGSVMLFTHIGLFQGIFSGTPESEDIDSSKVEYKPISESSDVTLLNAEFNLQQGLKPLQTDRSVQMFLDDQTNEPRGYVKLARPILLQNAQEIAADIVSAENAQFAAGTYLKLVLRGGITIKR